MKRHEIRRKTNRKQKKTIFSKPSKRQDVSVLGYISATKDNGQFEGKPYNALGITKTRLPQSI